MTKWIIGVCVVCVLCNLIFSGNTVELGPGIKAPEIPDQTVIDRGDLFIHKNAEVVPLAYYTIRAKVLARRSYKRSRGGKVCPMDMALGWGIMSDEEVLKDIIISQSGRFYYWQTTNGSKISRKEVIANSANVHLIPSTDSVDKTLRSMKIGQIINIQGQLVKVKCQDGWQAESSLSRRDTGSGACEVLYVESVF